MSAPADPNADLVGLEFTEYDGLRTRVDGTTSWSLQYMNVTTYRTSDGSMLSKSVRPTALVRHHKAFYES